jgi:acetyl esterase/lipase/lysophospholipase L1-like esterase
MMKTWFKSGIKWAMLLPLMCCGTMNAQTARSFTLYNSADSASTLEVFLPEHPTGRAVVDCPGGGYVYLAKGHEGYDWVDYFNKQGIAYCILTYRMPKGDRNIPLSDAYHAIATVRDSADVWHVNPYDVGIMGFSAGGHLASSVSTHAPFESRPNFSILFYPVISMDEKETHQGSCEGFLGEGRHDSNLVNAWSNYKVVSTHLTPPAAIFMAADDGLVPPSTNGIKYYESMIRAGVPCAMYIYPSGGHGFGFNADFAYHDQMLNELTTWLNNLPAPKSDALRVACIGNSITDGYGIEMCSVNGYPAQLQQLLGDGYNVRNFGRSSRTMLNKGDYPYMNEEAWQHALAFNPNVVIVKLGTNDSKPENWQYGKEYEHDLQQMVDSLKSLPANPSIYLATPIPAYKGTWNISDEVITNEIMPIIRKVAKKNKLKVIDFHAEFGLGHDDMMLDDGIHPNAAGAGLMAKIVAKYIQADFNTEAAK